MSEKPKIALYWCASCGGCEESVVDLAEDILFVVDNVDIVLWPVGLDFKKKDVEAMPDGSIVASLINGAIRTTEQEEMARMLRRKSQVVIAYGACAQLGGIPGLANQFSLETILKFVYEEAPSVVNELKTRPLERFKDNGRTTELPGLWNVVRTLDQVIDVEYYIPGCPPSPKLLKEAVLALLSGHLPPVGTVLAPDIALCEECSKKDTKPTDLKFESFKRTHLWEVDPEKCLLSQGFLCMGPATRSGCGALCVEGNMPCTGCYGPTSRVRDQGAKFLSSISSSIGADSVEDIDKILVGIPDPVGTFYRYGLPGSMLKRKVVL
ncbi:MAG: ubiquinone oxidoreductase 20 kDa subunit [Ignavibacteria bacterium]|nr:ubiquinone oxidoreductase 20 kDa subunit [Ignavibacteria bacterium]